MGNGSSRGRSVRIDVSVEKGLRQFLTLVQIPIDISNSLESSTYNLTDAEGLTRHGAATAASASGSEETIDRRTQSDSLSTELRAAEEEREGQSTQDGSQDGTSSAETDTTQDGGHGEKQTRSTLTASIRRALFAGKKTKATLSATLSGSSPGGDTESCEPHGEVHQKRKTWRVNSRGEVVFNLGGIELVKGCDSCGRRVDGRGSLKPRRPGTPRRKRSIEKERRVRREQKDRERIERKIESSRDECVIEILCEDVEDEGVAESGGQKTVKIVNKCAECSSLDMPIEVVGTKKENLSVPPPADRNVPSREALSVISAVGVSLTESPPVSSLYLEDTGKESFTESLDQAFLPCGEGARPKDTFYRGMVPNVCKSPRERLGGQSDMMGKSMTSDSDTEIQSRDNVRKFGGRNESVLLRNSENVPDLLSGGSNVLSIWRSRQIRDTDGERNPFERQGYDVRCPNVIGDSPETTAVCTSQAESHQEGAQSRLSDPNASERWTAQESPDVIQDRVNRLRGIARLTEDEEEVKWVVDVCRDTQLLSLDSETKEVIDDVLMSVFGPKKIASIHLDLRWMRQASKGSLIDIEETKRRRLAEFDRALAEIYGEEKLNRVYEDLAFLNDTSDEEPIRQVSRDDSAVVSGAGQVSSPMFKTMSRDSAKGSSDDTGSSVLAARALWDLRARLALESSNDVTDDTCQDEQDGGVSEESAKGIKVQSAEEKNSSGDKILPVSSTKKSSKGRLFPLSLFRRKQRREYTVERRGGETTSSSSVEDAGRSALRSFRQKLSMKSRKKRRSECGGCSEQGVKLLSRPGHPRQQSDVDVATSSKGVEQIQLKAASRQVSWKDEGQEKEKQQRLRSDTRKGQEQRSSRSWLSRLGFSKRVRKESSKKKESKLPLVTISDVSALAPAERRSPLPHLASVPTSCGAAGGSESSSSAAVASAASQLMSSATIVSGPGATISRMKEQPVNVNRTRSVSGEPHAPMSRRSVGRSEPATSIRPVQVFHSSVSGRSTNASSIGGLVGTETTSTSPAHRDPMLSGVSGNSGENLPSDGHETADPTTPPKPLQLVSVGASLSTISQTRLIPRRIPFTSYGTHREIYAHRRRHHNITLQRLSESSPKRSEKLCDDTHVLHLPLAHSDSYPSLTSPEEEEEEEEEKEN